MRTDAEVIHEVILPEDIAIRRGERGRRILISRDVLGLVHEGSAIAVCLTFDINADDLRRVRHHIGTIPDDAGRRTDTEILLPVVGVLGQALFGPGRDGQLPEDVTILFIQAPYHSALRAFQPRVALQRGIIAADKDPTISDGGIAANEGA